MSLGGVGRERTPEFYADLVTSDEILRQTVVGKYSFDESDEEGDLTAYYEIEEDTSEKEIERAVERLKKDLSVSTDRETRIVSFSVTTSKATVSQQVAAHILELVNTFDLITRQSQAGAERTFAGERLAELTGELRDAEDSLEVFLVGNRDFSNSPVLTFEHDRLQRIVGMRQEVVTSIAQAFERARIEEVRNTPVITMIESPRVPAFRDSKGRILIVLLGIVAGAMVGGLLGFVKDYSQARNRGAADLEELSSLWRETLTGLPMGRRLFRDSMR